MDRIEYPLGQVRVEGVITKTRCTGDHGWIAVSLSDVTVTYLDTNKVLHSGCNGYRELGCTGYVKTYKENIRYILHGKIEPSDYGNQLHMSSMYEAAPENISDLYKYLLNCNISGISQTSLWAIIKSFENPNDAIDTIWYHPEDLLGADIGSASETSVNTLAEYMCQRNEFSEEDAMKALLNHGLSEGKLSSVEDYFESFECAWDRVRKDPYILMRIDGIGFNMADKIACKLNMDPADSKRLTSLLLYAAERACCESGSTIITKNAIIPAALDVLTNRKWNTNDDDDDAYVQIIDEKFMNRLRRELDSFAQRRRKPLIVLGDDYSSDTCLVQPCRYYQWESEIIDSATDMVHSYGQRLLSSDVLERDILIEQQWFNRYEHYMLDDEQLAAVRMVFQNRLSLFTGDAGTGKTSTVEMIVRIARREKISFALCAPTGMAAKRIGAACGGVKSPLQSYTIHKLLGPMTVSSIMRATSDFEDADIVICDETSMLDTQIASRLFTACCQNDKRLLLIGDVKQLPSVGAGDVFNDLLNCSDIKHVRLTNVHRQSKDGLAVLAAARAVINGCSPIVSDIDFYQCSASGVLQTLDELLPKLIDERLSLYGDGPHMAFLAPTNKCVNMINTRLRVKFNHNVDPYTGNKDFQQGDFVMQMRNRYKDSRGKRIPCMNGERGIVQWSDGKGACGVKFFDIDQIVVYTKADANEYLQLAYGSTVHKYQGSQCDTVVLIMTNDMGRSLNRKLLYTAITRAEKRLILVGDANAFVSAAYNLPPTRLTGLKDLRLM